GRPCAATASGRSASCWRTGASTTRPTANPGTSTGSSQRSAWPGTRTSASGSSPVGSGAGSTWPSASSAARNCCSSTNPRSGSTRKPAATSTTWCTSSPTRTPPSCPPPTTWPKPRSWPDRILILAGGRIVANGSAEQLSRQIAAASEIKWTIDGQRYVHSAEDATGFVRELLAQHGEAVTDLEVRRATLEDTYLALV